MDTCIFVLSWSLLSQFIEVSYPQVFNLDSGVTQPQLSSAAAAVIVPRLRANENPLEENEICCYLQENGTYLLND